MHVCEVIKTLDIGGAETLLVARLRAAPPGKRYTVVCLQAATPVLIDRLRAAGVAVVDLTARPRALRLALLPGVVRRLRPDVVNCHSPLPAVVLRLGLPPGRRRPPLVSTVHLVTHRRSVLLADRATRRLDDHTVAVSEEIARCATARRRRGVSVRRHGVDLAAQRRHAAEAAVIRKELDVPDGACLVAHVANFHPVKDHATLVEAAARVTAADPRALFLLAGTGPLLPRISGRVAALGLDRVRLLGLVPDAARLVAAADLLVLSSCSEGLPVVVMEAFAAGVPVVATRVGGLPDLVTDGENGLLVPPGDPGALAGAVLRAMRPAVRDRLAAAARRSGEGLDIADTARWFDRLYDELAGARRARGR
ncbi:hypothetical protein Sru01_36860 [Sphaerisporangium rufum]|uniref:Glycosyltransferase subfamily 4-like N-terminal domain-containing protein n=1 Tax=Sphaerisporangium rufum TaxID=1381558 RepID=A0A919V0F2_9ACTN|nr:glycosyltransferase [Sphaerisporangium rufum]GII78704.1 hypothetical protein Sru01_36860 [Sphaerisporangium rufum]